MTGPSTTNLDPCDHYDVVIVGAGHAGLATLSALQESYSLDHLTDTQRNQILSSSSNNRQQCQSTNKRRSICVIDPSGEWMTNWNQNFDKLKIKFLRSPALAHPDAFDQHALLAFAVARGRQDELTASGCSDAKQLQGLPDAHNGLWDMPSRRLFADFCRHTAQHLKHTMVTGSVQDIHANASTNEGTNKTNEAKYTIRLQNSRVEQVTANAVVLATGPVGTPIVPKGIQPVPESRWMHWTNLDRREGIPTDWKDILVVGGGLTAVQVAQLAVDQRGRKVTLCSRRPLVEKHLDVGLEWFDPRQASKCHFDFYHQPMEDRLNMLKEARGGGSVPPCYMRQVEALEAQGRLKCLVGQPNFVSSLDDDNHLENGSGHRHNGPLVFEIDSQMHQFDGVLVACGVLPDCSKSAVCQSLVTSQSSNNYNKVFSGLPVVSEDLEWFPNLFVVGSLASLNLGPDAGNLMGMRRGATLVANALGCRSWLRETGNLYANRYNIFLDDDSDTESETSESSKE